MEIVVCAKRVAATDTAVKVGPDGKSIDPGGVEFVLNPYDEIALEQALLTRDALGTGSVTVVSLGPVEAQKELRTCLAMGADRAVLLQADGWIHDSFSAAETLARYIAGIPHDLVLLGKQAVDSDNSQMAQRLAVLLDMPCIPEVSALTLADGVFTAERDIEGAREVVRCPVPAVISCNKGLNEPRYASLKGIMAAKKKPLEQVPAEQVPAATEVVSLRLPPDRPPSKILGEGPDAVGALIEALKSEVRVL